MMGITVLLRILFWLILYLLLLGLVSFYVSYKDGLTVDLKGWPELLSRAKAGRKE